MTEDLEGVHARLIRIENKIDEIKVFLILLVLVLVGIAAFLTFL